MMKMSAQVARCAWRALLHLFYHPLLETGPVRTFPIVSRTSIGMRQRHSSVVQLSALLFPLCLHSWTTVVINDLKEEYVVTFHI